MDKGELKLLENIEANLMLTLGAEREGDISDIDDCEIGSYILTVEESDLKSRIWHSENGEWLQKKLLRDEEKPSPFKVEQIRPTSPTSALQSALCASTRIKIEAIGATFDRSVESTPIIKLNKT